MCGIAGFYGFRNDDLIHKISKKLEHRGPDGEGFYIDDTVTLLNRRLAIIDRKGGDQPIFNEDRTVVVSYNGEIYNYRELRKELEKQGHAFSTKSDTEVIIHGYEEFGETYFDRMNGMFGLALYDTRRKKLVLARDHFGIKPLYYSFPKAHPLQLIFSSEITPIVTSGLVKKSPNDRTIYRYLMFRVQDDGKDTFFEGVYRLLPGQVMIIEDGKTQTKNFSNLENDLLGKTGQGTVDNQTVSRFKSMLSDAIRLRLISEVPVGSCLSGGLDSSTVVSIVNRLLKEKVREAKSVGKIQNTFSAVFPGQSNDEGSYINALLAKTKVASHTVKPTPEEFFDNIRDFVKTQEEPTISTGPYAQYKVMQLAHKKVTVTLDGQGSDEMMAGYVPYYFVYLRQLMNKGNFISLLREIVGSLDVLFKSALSLKKKIDTKLLLHKKYLTEYEGEKFSVTNDNLKKRLLEDIFRNSLQSLLRYEDRNAMRFSIEGRVPFLDFNLLRYLFSLSDEAIIKNGWNKRILREATKDILTRVINQRRNKIGFTTPEYEWFMRMKNRIYSIFLSESFAKRKYFSQQEILKAFQSFVEGKVDDTMIFWRLLNLELWLREFFVSPTKKGSEYKSVNPDIKVDGKRYVRRPIKTDLFKKNDDYAKKIAGYVVKTIGKRPVRNRGWFVVVSEKIIAIAQGRSYFIWDMKPSLIASVLSRFVTKTPFGIGLGSPWTMQLAISEVGLPKILLATLVSFITKPFGIKGMFYRIAGPQVRSIDGPTEYSLYPSNMSAKLGPKNPEDVAQRIHRALNNKYKMNNRNFLGAAIIDANDLGQNILGNSTKLSDRLIEKIFRDNPMGQTSEQTPITLVFLP